jgi:hypothetical protein
MAATRRSMFSRVFQSVGMLAIGVGVVVEWMCGGTGKRADTKVCVGLDEEM